MIGTSLTYTTKLLRKVGGWPTRSQGKDGPLASRILKLGREVQFADITTDMPLIVSMQHKANIWKRPALEKGQTGKQGSFVLTGLGHFDEVPEISSETKNLLSYVQEGQLISVVTAQPSPKEVTPEVILPTTFTGELWTSVSGGHGTLAYADGLKVLGFRQVAFKESELKLAKGIPVLYHGWRNDLKVWGKKYPGKVVVLWHSGWTGSDIMGEGQALAEVIECAVQGIIKLLWLEQRDVLPPNAIQAYPVWDPEAMSKIADPRPAKIPNNVVVGLHNDWAALCKNSLAAIAGCSQVPNIKIHTSVPAMRGARGLTAQKLLKNVNHEIHPMMSKKDAINLVASCDLLVHPSVSDTWPYLVMESIYNGTPVVVSGTIAWAKDLSKWAQDKCLIQANCSSKSISQKVKELIEDEESLTRLLKEQKICLDSLAKHYQNKMIETLNKVNFNIKKPASLFTPDTLHLLIDSPNWAFDRIATQIQRHSKYDVQKHYICEHETIKEGVVFWWRGYHKYVEHPEKSMVCIYDFLSWDEQTVIDIFSKFKVIGVANELLYEKLIKFPVLQNKPMFILRDGVDTDMFTCVSMIKNTNKLQVGWVGNSAWGDDSDFKGFKILQEVQKKTKAFCDWHIADKKQGGTPFEDMPNYYKKLDVITCFSKAEGTPNPALEGASSGCFVLSTQVGLVPEMEKTGCVVKTLDRDVDSFVKFLKKLYQNNTLIKEARKINPQIMKKEWDWKVRIKDWQKALECLKTEPTEIIADLSDVVTVFVTTVGAPDFPHCLDCLNKQDVKFQLKVICNVAPMSAAFQKMIDDCTTEYYIQIDEDMLLYPHAIRTLYEKMKQQDKKVGVFFMGLHDVFTDFCLVGVKIYRHAVMKQFPYLKTDFSCEVDQIARMQKEHYRIEGETPGLHGQKELCVGDLNAFWTKWGVFEKYSRDMQKYRLYPQKQSWMKELPSLFIKKIQEGDELAIFALGGAIVGLTSSLQVSGEKDFTNPTFKHLFEDLNRIFTKRETQ
jgi:glycosyltransferase involved in cell wall biosynthesis